MSNRWKNIQNAFRLTSPPTTQQRHEIFQLISEGKSTEAIRLIEDYGDGDNEGTPLTELRDERQRTALHWAAMSTSERRVSDVLIERGCIHLKLAMEETDCMAQSGGPLCGDSTARSKQQRATEDE